MAGLSLNVLTENASRLGARIQESLQERTRDLGAQNYFDAPEEKIKQIRTQLDSNSDREKLDGLKRLIALISKGRNLAEFFPYVVKNVASSNLEIRKMVYIFLLRYAHAEPDLALLSINTFQRDLADPNPLIRAMALRVLSGINVPMVAGIVVMAIKKCAADGSPYVRKAAALALVKCYNMDPSQLPSLLPILTSLLASHASSPHAALSAGPAARALLVIAPTRLDLIHPHFRRLARILVDADAWGQVDLLELLVRYSRRMLAKPTDGDVDPDLKLLLDCTEPLFMSRNPAAVMAATRAYFYLAPPSQHTVFVRPLLRLLHTSTEVERVVLSYLEIITKDEPHLFAPHHAYFIVRSSDNPATKHLKLLILSSLLNSENWAAILREFVTYAEDSDISLAASSIACIGACARSVQVPEAGKQCLDALLEFVKKGSETAISSSVLELKSIVQTHLSTSNPSSLSFSPYHVIASLALKLPEIKHPAARACVVWLVGQYAAVSETDSTLGHTGIGFEGLSGVAYWAPDVLREIAKSFAGESTPVKRQTLTLAAKILVLIAGPTVRPEPISSSPISTLQLLTRHIFNLARYDTSYDVRDRARMLVSLLTGVAPWLSQSQTNGFEMIGEDAVSNDGRGGVVLRREQVKLVLFEGKVVAAGHKVPTSASSVPPIPSLGAVLSRPMDIDTLTSLRLPDWPDEGTDPSLRDSELEHPSAPVPTSFGAQRGSGMSLPPSTNQDMTSALGTPVGTPPVHGTIVAGATGGKGAWMDLDSFYAENEEEESEEEDEDESDSDEEEETEEDEGSGESHKFVGAAGLSPESVAPHDGLTPVVGERHQSDAEAEESDEEESDEVEEDETAQLTSSPWNR